MKRVTMTVTMVALVACMSVRAKATEYVIQTDTSWHAIGPVGNLEGNPLSAVGLGFEASNPGWNNSLGYDDGPGSGWHSPLVTWPQSVVEADVIWPDGDGRNGSTPAYFRHTFTLDGPVLSGLLHCGADDDMQLYINGSLVFEDVNRVAGPYEIMDVTSYLHDGVNLLAAKVQDSAYLVPSLESFRLRLDVETVPEPATVSLLVLGLTGLAVRRRRKD